MEFPDYFADAESSYAIASYIIFGIPYEHSSSFRHGADKAPQMIREASWNYETYDLITGFDLSEISFHDYGDLPVQKLQPAVMYHQVTTFIKKIISDNKFPLAIGGDHSITPGIIHALPNDCMVVVLDAHLDYRQEYNNDPFNHACVIRRIADFLPPSHIHVIGVRSAEKQEYLDAQKDGIHIISNHDIRIQGLQSIIASITKQCAGYPLYLSLDIDVIDPAYAPATSTPEPFGLAPLEVLTILEHLPSPLIGYDTVEVCPSYDHGQTALLAAKLLRYIIQFHSRKPKP
ncbi:MAG: agmatinase [Candidatus Thermoplasmatota archaeon]|nr:agmatinase [Candidatus Thermoplasmatota archaeon]MBU1941826.1 agmatinase [Candidatus Thermoplasmatota archaeon]